MHSVHNDLHYLCVWVTDKVDQQSLYEAQADLMLHPEYPHKNSLWMFDEACECVFSNICMFDMLSRIKNFFPVNGTKQKAAMLATTNTFYSFVKLFCDEAEHEGIPFTVKPFRNFDDANAWLIDA
ncbi:MAG: hypothetical protein HGB22_10855 [Chlorobiaceae bacterium]|nr:hypothetical protein [Chlorobiaceae bacterium]